MPRLSKIDTPNKLIATLADEALSAAELMTRLDCSQPTLSRMVRNAGSTVIALGRAQQTRYARVRNAGVEQPLSITRIDATGTPISCGTLHTIGSISGGRTAHVAARRVTIFVGLPWFVQDMRPQGFIGRQFPMRVSLLVSLLDRQLRLPSSVTDWSDNHVLQALSAAGFDEPGDLILGRAPLDQFLAQPAPQAITTRRKATVYAQLANQNEGERRNPSSAVGEQPKFTTFAAMSNNAPIGEAHVIVKYSPQGTSDIAQRWRDLLRAEHHALNVINDSHTSTGLRAANTEIIDADRLYLEVQRFDRVGEHGRLGVVSLGAIDDEFVGLRGEWIQTAHELQNLHMLKALDVNKIALLQAFGKLIHNTDMHFGNCALRHENLDAQRLTLAPIYDMLPMAFAPTSQGLGTDNIRTITPTADLLTVWPQAIELAREFWVRVIADRNISAGFRLIAKKILAATGGR